MLNTLTLYDFILAQTVLRLELFYLAHDHNPALASGKCRQIYYSSTMIAEVLRDSLQVWGKLDMMKCPRHAYSVCQETENALSDYGQKLRSEDSYEIPILVAAPEPSLGRVMVRSMPFRV